MNRCSCFIFVGEEVMYMLRKMDVRLDQAFDQMIVSKLRTGPMLFTGDKLVLGETWVGSICNIAAEFEALADPDALNAIPILASVCESKSIEVQSMDISDAVFIMQSSSNPDKYTLTPRGRKNADSNSDGVTNGDALNIQKKLLMLD